MTAILGIIGGGQLGRMLSVAAARYGYRSHVWSPEPDSPAFDVCASYTCAPYTDEPAAAAFIDAVDIATIETEHIPLSTLRRLAERIRVAPGLNSIAAGQNRVVEKQVFTKLAREHPHYQIQPVPYRVLSSPDRAQLDQILSELAPQGEPTLLKTATLGYDGKGQYRLASSADCPTPLAGAYVLERCLDLDSEFSVTVGRDNHGLFRVYPPAGNLHRDGILVRSDAPLAELYTIDAVVYTLKLAETLDLRGVMTVEFFVDRHGVVWVNELAPRPHNTGHWTLDGAVISQFDLLVEMMFSVCSLSAGIIPTVARVRMDNLLGELAPTQARAQTYARRWIYGKREHRTQRKLGHINYLYVEPEPCPEFYLEALAKRAGLGLAVATATAPV